MTWAGVRGDGPRPCYSAEWPRPDDAARSAEPRAVLGNGSGDHPDGAGPCLGLPCHCSRRCRVSASGSAGPGRPAAPPCLCYCAAAAFSSVTPSRERGRERGGRGLRGNNSGWRRRPAEGAWGRGPWPPGRAWPGPPPGAPPARPSSRALLARGRFHVERRKWSRGWVASSETLR
jgi:hypothetical protein